MDLSIIVVNYNTRELTLQCLKSIRRFLGTNVSYEIIVVDNYSSDGSQKALRDYAAVDSGIVLIESDENYGFAHANNRGLRIAQGRQVLLLNSDAYLIDNSLLEVMHFLDRSADVFGCGCTLVLPDTTPTVSYGKFPQLLTVLREILLNKFAHLRGIIPPQRNGVHDIDMPCGAFFLMKRDLLERIGLLDETFFMYYEETDLAYRAWKAGYRIVHYGPATAVHLGGRSSMPSGDEEVRLAAWKKIRAIFYQSWRYFLVKHGFLGEANVIRGLLTVFFTAHYLAAFMLGKRTMVLNYRYELETLHQGWKPTVFCK